MEEAKALVAVHEHQAQSDDPLNHHTGADDGVFLVVDGQCRGNTQNRDQNAAGHGDRNRRLIPVFHPLARSPERNGGHGIEQREDHQSQPEGHAGDAVDQIRNCQIDHQRNAGDGKAQSLHRRRIAVPVVVVLGKANNVPAPGKAEGCNNLKNLQPGKEYRISTVLLRGKYTGINGNCNQGYTFLQQIADGIPDRGFGLR